VWSSEGGSKRSHLVGGGRGGVLVRWPGGIVRCEQGREADGCTRMAQCWAVASDSI
jgi:hypothetical protein